MSKRCLKYFNSIYCDKQNHDKILRQSLINSHNMQTILNELNDFLLTQLNFLSAHNLLNSLNILI